MLKGETDNLSPPPGVTIVGAAAGKISGSFLCFSQRCTEQNVSLFNHLFFSRNERQVNPSFVRMPM